MTVEPTEATLPKVMINSQRMVEILRLLAGKNI
jgi:hypothetical protein